MPFYYSVFSHPVFTSPFIQPLFALNFADVCWVVVRCLLMLSLHSSVSFVLTFIFFPRGSSSSVACRFFNLHCNSGSDILHDNLPWGSRWLCQAVLAKSRFQEAERYDSPVPLWQVEGVHPGNWLKQETSACRPTLQRRGWELLLSPQTWA